MPRQLSRRGLVLAVAGLFFSACGPAESPAAVSRQQADTLVAEGARPLYPWGMPTTGHPGNVVLHNTCFDVCYAPDLLTPLWAAYYYPGGVHGKFARRSFTNDPRFDPQAGPAREDFDGIYRQDRTGFDRGHVAPHASLNPFGLEAVKESYYVTNATPQHTNLNQGFWKWLEDSTRAWAGDGDTVWVVTGPVFYPGVENDRAKQGGRIPVPHAYFQAVVRMNRSGAFRTPEAQAFLVPHSADGYAWAEAESFLVAIDSIEKVTGLDLFPLLPEALESAPAAPWWR
jgi:endonuclease G